MPWTRLNWVDRTVDSPVTYQDINDVGGAADDAYDAFNAEHDPTDGSHDAFHLPKLVAQITNTGTPSVARQGGKWAITSISRIAAGHVRITIDAQVNASDQYAVMVTPHSNESLTVTWQHNSIGTGTTTFDVYTWQDGGSSVDSGVDRNFSLVVYGTT